MKKVAFYSILFLTFFSAHAFAGKDRGGGVVFVCNDKIYLADSYDFRQSKLFKQLKRLNLHNSEASLKVAINEVQKDDRELGLALESTDKKLYEVNVEYLPLLGDDQINEKKYKGCEKRQLAVQTFSTGEIKVVTSLKNQLSRFDRQLFEAHEGELHLQWEREQSTDITKVRGQVANWAESVGNEQLAACGLHSFQAMAEFWISQKAKFAKIMSTETYISLSEDGRLVHHTESDSSPYGEVSVFDKNFPTGGLALGRKLVGAYYQLRTGQEGDYLDRTLEDIANIACGGAVKYAYGEAASRFVMADYGTFLSYLVIEPNDKTHFVRDVSVDTKTVENKIDKGDSPTMRDLGDSLSTTTECARNKIHPDRCRGQAKLDVWNMHGWDFFFREEVRHYRKGLHW